MSSASRSMSPRKKKNKTNERKTCVNGCDAPVCPPSKVICRACLDKITAKLEAFGERWKEKTSE